MTVKHILASGSLVLIVFLTSAVTAFPSEPGIRYEEIERVEKAMEVLEGLVALPEEGLPEALLRRAHAVAIIPGVIKAAYGIGGHFGRGLICFRNTGEEGWSSPLFIKILGGSVGWQIGIQKMDIVLVFKTEESIRDIAEGKITLGADMAVTAGPVGRRVEASTDLDLEAEIYSYARSKGLFAGISLKGAVLRVDDIANREFYSDPGIGTETILEGRRLDAPPAALEIRRLLNRTLDGFGEFRR